MKCVTLFLIGLVVLVNGDRKTSCSDGWMSFEDYCYLFAHGIYTFPDAEHYCRQHNSHVLQITNAIENAFVKDHLRDLKNQSWWLGITDEVVEGSWRYYASGTDVDFTDWHPGQPDAPKYGEDCAFMPYFWDYQWADYRCDSKQGVVCKQRGSTEETISAIG